MTSKQKFLIITSAGLAIGIAEALIFYNLGRNANTEEGFKFELPQGKELARTLGMVILTSLLTAQVSNSIEKIVAGKTLKASII